MKQDLVTSLRAAIVSLLAFTVLTGLVYPLVVTCIGKTAFAHQAAGDPALIGETFTDPKYFWSRPGGHDATSSAASNLGEGNPALHAAVAARVAALREADPGNTARVPVDLVTTSGSGLDPHITPAAAYYQAGRVARVRGLPLVQVRALIEAHTERRTFGILGEPRVNVADLNRALDAR